jgi:hypothetical protein
LKGCLYSVPAQSFAISGTQKTILVFQSSTEPV